MKKTIFILLSLLIAQKGEASTTEVLRCAEEFDQPKAKRFLQASKKASSFLRRGAGAPDGSPMGTLESFVDKMTKSEKENRLREEMDRAVIGEKSNKIYSLQIMNTSLESTVSTLESTVSTLKSTVKTLEEKKEFASKALESKILELSSLELSNKIFEEENKKLKTLSFLLEEKLLLSLNDAALFKIMGVISYAQERSQFFFFRDRNVQGSLRNEDTNFEIEE